MLKFRIVQKKETVPVQLLLQKIGLNILLDLKWICKSHVSLSDRLLYTARKYRAILRKKDHVNFYGSNFFYDNNLTPALLPHYHFELAHLGELVDFKNVKSVLDIGANIGQFAYVLKKIHPHISVYSFEPNPQIFKILEKNSQSFDGWRCFPFGISEKESSVPFYFVNGKSAQGSIYAENAVEGLLSNQVQKIDVSLKPLRASDLQSLQIPTKIDLIKVDVEGAEFDVLKSLGEIDWRYLYIELSASRKGSGSVSDALALLQKTSRGKVSVVYTDEGQTYQALFATIAGTAQRTDLAKA